ncbi:efflux RND transporter periplasmic adaptor subunit [Pseudomonas sp. CFBP 8771]|uniref:efflux RND transporter periplasmic adaptor subunit n=1 Tax=Pseudomonas sp. CFBP 8771 TaxID=2775285 RepID=UPI00177E8100|nr:efflux RND transporter periplasmic adaptor subunit [Pseudomonas sp. CFBP 8771]MBD8602421.1 efflux RND transporter periplasmic adaptor subunit [Pseudomonas sp. CFBP 8771]
MRIAIRPLLLAGLLLVVVSGAAWLLLDRTAANKPVPAMPIPVRVVTVVQADVPRYLTGIGSVLSLHSVTVRAQVDGVLAQVAVKEGQWVNKGDALASIDDRAIRASLAQARAQASQSQAQLQVAGVNLRRYKDLSRDNGISRQLLDEQQALFDQLTATLQGNQAAIAAAQVQLSYTQIHSPVTGRVGIRRVDPGNFLRVSDAEGLFTVTQIDPIAVEFSLPQQELATLQSLLDRPQPAVVRAYLDGDTETGKLVGEGHLTLLDNQIAASTGTIRAKAEFHNGRHTLWPGQLVSVGLQVGVERNALVVPLPVVQRGIEGHYVYRVTDAKVEQVPVQVRYQTSTQSLIDGVAAGDVLVSDGQSRLRPGARVQVLEPTVDNAATLR